VRQNELISRLADRNLLEADSPRRQTPENPPSRGVFGEASDIRATSVERLTSSQQERRKHPRFPTNDPGLVRVLGPVPSSYVAVRILDTSQEGLKLRLPAPLDPGTSVQVRLAAAVAFGEVRYCCVCGAVYHAGVHLSDVFPTLSVRAQSQEG
jgi:PilZ domain